MEMSVSDLIAAELGIILIADVYVAVNAFRHRGLKKYPRK